MPTTTELLLPYPAATDPADVPADIKKLDDRIEALYGAPNGIAGLDSTGKVPTSQLASGSAEIVYAQVTTAVVVDTSALKQIIACPSTVYSAARVLAEFFCPSVVPADRDVVAMYLFEDGVVLGQIAVNHSVPTSGSSNDLPVYCQYRFTPAAGAHVYSVWANRISQTGLTRGGPGGAGQFVPMFLRLSYV